MDLDRKDLSFARLMVLKELERRDAECVAVTADDMAAQLGITRDDFLHYVSVHMLPGAARLEDGVLLYDVERTLRKWKILERDGLIEPEDLLGPEDQDWLRP